MKDFETNSKDEIFTRLPKNVFFVDKNLNRKYDLTSVLPGTLYTALNIYGTNIERNEILENNDKTCTQRLFSLRIKLLIAHFPILLSTAMQIIGYDHVTFFISVLLDSSCFLGGLYIFLYRRKEIVIVLKELAAVPSKTSKQTKGCNFQKTTVLLITVLSYATIYLTYSFVFNILNLSKLSEINTDLTIEYLELFAIASYCIILCTGISIHLSLFVQFASLISDRLLFVEQECHLGNEIITPENICKQRRVFSNLQKISSTSDSIFKELIFLWLMKIITRGCLSAVDIFSRSWTNAESFTQILVIFDAMYDLFHLLILCIYAGKIDDAKVKLLQTLIYMGSRYSVKNQVRDELHLFISMVSHSKLGFTVADIFFLNKSTALTILGALGSYCVLIYQFTSK